MRATLTESLGTLDLVGEEDSDDLRSPERAALLQGVVATDGRVHAQVIDAVGRILG